MAGVYIVESFEDPTVEKIDLTEQLKELLMNSPISGRSDYRGEIHGVI